jgi:hypothetical protein
MSLEDLCGNEIAAVASGSNKTQLTGYDIEGIEEPCLFAGLVAMQLKTLIKALRDLECAVEMRGSRLDVIEDATGNDGLMVLIHGVKKRIIAQLWIVGACSRLE